MNAARVPHIHADLSSRALSVVPQVREANLGNTSAPLETAPSSAGERDPELSLYRPRTLGLLKRYLQLSAAVGRLPSIIAREGFRAHVSSYRMHTFEDSVIFVLDIERSIDRLAPREQALIAHIIFQGHSHDSAAEHFGCTRKTLTQDLCDALDHLSELMLARSLLQPL